MLNHLLLMASLYRITTAEPLEFVSKARQDVKLQAATSGGIVQGSKDVTYYKFLGIPFAEPPVGQLRWKPPAVHKRWNGVLNATRERSICVQMSTDFGTEDCLFVNVYTPIKDITQVDRKKLMPVMVWIYGGRFANGISNYTVYGPDYLLEHDVVFVSFNYRLGIFGFLSTEDTVVPGNYGLKDQVAVLEWVHVNIANFGGDPHLVTIFGESSGAASVSYMLLIKQARGLFHRAISESGCSLCPWAFQRDPRKVAIRLAHACGIFESNMITMVDRLRAEETRKLRNRMRALNIGNWMDPLNGLPFAPCIEPEHQNALLTNRSHDVFMRGGFYAVPYMIGFTSQEASIVQDIIELTRPYIAHWDMLPQLLVPKNLNVSAKGRMKEVAQKIKNYYFGKKYISMSSKTEMMNFIGDSQFVRSIRHNIQICARFTTIYFYVFSYEGFLGRYGTKKEIIRKVKGAGHVEDLFYIFKKANVTTTNATDLAVIKSMTLLWTNFAREGKCLFHSGSFSNPTPQNANMKIYWPPINANDTSLTYLDIDSTLSVRKNFRADAMDFWDDLYKQYGNDLYDTY